jgi:hypothetical protein
MDIFRHEHNGIITEASNATSLGAGIMRVLGDQDLP